MAFCYPTTRSLFLLTTRKIKNPAKAHLRRVLRWYAWSDSNRRPLDPESIPQDFSILQDNPVEFSTFLDSHHPTTFNPVLKCPSLLCMFQYFLFMFQDSLGCSVPRICHADIDSVTRANHGSLGSGLLVFLHISHIVPLGYHLIRFAVSFETIYVSAKS